MPTHATQHPSIFRDCSLTSCCHLMLRVPAGAHLAAAASHQVDAALCANSINSTSQHILQWRASHLADSDVVRACRCTSGCSCEPKPQVDALHSIKAYSVMRGLTSCPHLMPAGAHLAAAASPSRKWTHCTAYTSPPSTWCSKNTMLHHAACRSTFNCSWNSCARHLSPIGIKAFHSSCNDENSLQ
jgi:hypothetical protein